MNGWLDQWGAPTAIIGAVGVIVTWAGVAFTRSSSKDTLLLASRDDHIDDLREDLRETRNRLDQLDEIVRDQGRQLRQLETREAGMRRYVHVLTDFIVARGHQPPPPPEYLKI